MKLELDINSSQNKSLINHSETASDSGSEEVKKMLRSGISLAKEGNRAEARQMLLGVTEVEPNNETAWLWLASISEYPEELLVFLQNVLKVNPENERALEWAKQTKTLLSKTFVQRGINAAQNNQKDFAKQCFLQGIVHDSENEMAWLWLASSSDSQEEKVSHLQQVLRINPDNETALSSLSAVKGQMSQGLLKKANSAAISGDHEAARQTLNTIMKNSPNIEEAWILKAFLASDFYEKVECYEKALEINPECEAAQAGLASLKLLMPKIPKVSETVVNEEVIAEEAIVQEEEVSAATEAVEFDNNFDLEQLAEELPAEEVEMSLVEEQVSEEELVVIDEIEPEQAQPESRAFAEEVLFEKQQEEIAIHETQTSVKEDFSANPSQQVKVESIFNFEEVISQEAAFANESQSEADLEFSESSDNPTQELDEEFAQNAAASFNVSVEENINESHTQEEISEEVLAVDPEQEVVAEAVTELEDFYTEQASDSEEVLQSEAIEESVAVEQKKEVRITEVYDTEVTTAVYGSEFFANDGFVLVPQNDPFADHTQETVEFSYSEAEGVQETEEVAEAKQTEEVEQVAETQEVAEVEQITVSEQVEEVEEVVEALQDEQATETQEFVETQPVEEIEQVIETEEAEEAVELQETEEAIELQEAEQTEEVEQAIETQSVVEAEQDEEIAEAHQSTEQFEEVVENQIIEQDEEFDECLATRVFDQDNQEILRLARGEEIQPTAEAPQLEKTEELAEPEQFEQNEQVAEVEQTGETEQVAELEQTEEIEQVAEVEYQEEVVENQTIEQVEEVVEKQPTEQVEEVVENKTVEQVEEFDESLATRVFDKYNQEILRLARGEEIQPAAEAPQSEKTEELAETAQVEQTAQVAEDTIEVEEVEQNEEQSQLVSEMESSDSQTNLTQCPFCATENENQAEICNSCQAMLSMADLEMLISHKGVNQDLLLQAIERMEVEKSLREFDSEELSYLAIAHLNAKNLEKGFNYLQEAAELNPNDATLSSKIKFLKAHLEELTANKNATIGKNRTILVVDDSPTVRKLISGKLEKCGHSVLSAIDGMDALAKINEVIPDLILLDITMPRLDGYQVCKLIRNNEMTKDVPIVMISGKDGFFDKVRGRMAGSSGYITKPFGPDTLMKTIETYLS